NPDFSQVEADAAQLDINTQFALFYPEKRPFFLEGTDVFDTPFSAVYTRTVADPSWGVKLTGKEGKNGIGVFVAEDETTNLLLPFSQFSRQRTLEEDTLDAVLRYRRDVGSSSTVGALVTQREGGDYFNRVAGVDAVYRPTRTDRINVHFLDSQTEYPDAFVTELAEEGVVLPRGTFGGQAWRLSYTHNSRDWQWYGRADEVDRGFRADLGFMPRVGYEVKLAGLERRFWGKEGTWYTQINLGGDWDETQDVDGQLLEEELEMWLDITGPLQSFYSFNTGQRDQFWNGRLFHQRYTNLGFSIRPTGKVYFSLNGTIGDAIDFDHTRAGEELRLDPQVELILGQHLRLELAHTYQELEVAGGTLFEANLTQLETVYQINVRTFVRAIFQYTDIQNDQDLYAFEVDEQQEDLFTQLLFSYKLNPQTVLFLGYSDTSLGTQDLRLTRQDRTLFFKVGYALVL
ncbi:MAG TPA: DUF5916 domain-containing protein, partial [Thermoanaerobaculia bacterium]|nr:DUF5916 domain-containing protein [Thermoanaerobaculia bacterium]